MQEFQVFGLYHGVDSNCTFIVTYKGQPSLCNILSTFHFSSNFLSVSNIDRYVLADHQNTQSNLVPIGNYINIGRTNMSDMSFCAVCNVDIETIWNCGIRTIFDGVVLQSTWTWSAMLGPSCPFRDIARMSNINTKTTHPVQNLVPVSKMLVVVVYLQHWWTDRPCNTEHCTICEYVNIRARAHEGSCGLEGAL